MQHDSHARLRVPLWSKLAAFVSLNLRAVTGLGASIALAAFAWRGCGQNFLVSFLFGGGWGLSMLYGVQLRGIFRQDGSVSWTGAIASSILWVVATGPLFFEVDLVPRLLDAASLLTLVVYVASKLGCHRIGCCDWDRRERASLSLPMLEAIISIAQIALAVALWGGVPNGMIALLLIPIHLASWSLLKLLRVSEQ